MRVAENNTLENWLLGKFDCYSDEDGEVFGIMEKPGIENSETIIKQSKRLLEDWYYLRGYSDCWKAVLKGSGNLVAGFSKDEAGYQKYSGGDSYDSGYFTALDYFLNSPDALDTEKSVAQKIKEVLKVRK